MVYCTVLCCAVLVQVPGVQVAEVSFVNHTALVWGRGVSAAELVEAVEDVGFEAALKDDDDNQRIRPGVGANSGSDGVEGDADVVVSILSPKLMTSEERDEVKMLLMRVDGVAAVVVSAEERNLCRVMVWGFVSDETVVEVLRGEKYSVSPVTSATSSINSSEVSDHSSRVSDHSSSASSPVSNPNCFILPLIVGGMSCANCSKGVEKMLLRITGVMSVRVALLSGKVEVYYDNSVITNTNTLIDAVISMGYTAESNGLSYSAGSAKSQSTKKHSYGISGMSCASCVVKIESMLQALPGVVSATVSGTRERAVVELSDGFVDAVGPRDVMRKIDELGYKSRHLVGDTEEDGGEGVWRCV